MSETPPHLPIPRPIPTPTLVLGVWFPASVMLPAAEGFDDVPSGPRHKQRVYLTDQGLYVFGRPGNPDWWSTVDYEKTPKPPTSYAARQVGIYIETAAGQVIITPDSGCGCSHPLKRWAPTWATRVGSWEDFMASREGA